MPSLEDFNNLLQSCFVPELKRDLDSMPIESEHFAEYHKVLQLQLPLVYDYVQQQEALLNESHKEKETNEIQANLIVLLCELTAPTTVYSLTNHSLLNNANRLLQRFIHLNANIEKLIFAYYQNKLKKDSWKRHIGAVHGFMKFLQWRYNFDGNQQPSLKIETNWLNFCLAVGLNVRECPSPTYKQMSTDIFLIILQFGIADKIRSLNIHSVIYETVFNDIYSMDTPESTASIWNCLCCCLNFFENLSSWTWNQTDDMLDKLISNVSLANDTLTSITLINFVTKLGTFLAINHMEIEEHLAGDVRIASVLAECRNICSRNSSYTAFRWAKSILNMFVIESHRLLQRAETCEVLLLSLHRCYLACILAIPLEVIHQHLSQFFEKFIAVLMEVIVTHKSESITELVKQFLMTFHQQLSGSPHSVEHPQLNRCFKAIDQLLQNKHFL